MNGMFFWKERKNNQPVTPTNTSVMIALSMDLGMLYAIKCFLSA
jgi:hypothetical protein